MILESLEYSNKYLFLLIKKVVIIIYFLSLQSTYKNSILYYKAIKIIINLRNFVKVIFNIIKHYCNFLGLVAINKKNLLFV